MFFTKKDKEKINELYRKDQELEIEINKLKCELKQHKCNHDILDREFKGVSYSFFMYKMEICSNCELVINKFTCDDEYNKRLKKVKRKQLKKQIKINKKLKKDLDNELKTI